MLPDERHTKKSNGELFSGFLVYFAPNIPDLVSFCFQIYGGTITTIPKLADIHVVLHETGQTVKAEVDPDWILNHIGRLLPEHCQVLAKNDLHLNEVVPEDRTEAREDAACTYATSGGKLLEAGKEGSTTAEEYQRSRVNAPVITRIIPPTATPASAPNTWREKRSRSKIVELWPVHQAFSHDGYRELTLSRLCALSRPLQ